MAVIRMQAIVRGRVQGVFFRDYTAKEANRLCLCGWVKNRDDGTVETEFQGEEKEVSLMIKWLHTGSPLSQVTGVDASSIRSRDEESGFVVKY